MTERDDRRMRRRRQRHRALLMFAGVLAAGLAALIWILPPLSGEARLIDLERKYRFWRTAMGYPLAGTPDLANLDERLAAKGMSLGAPIFMRIFKREFELEIWMLKNGRYELFDTYPICRWSGNLGPKLATGDHQAPEGFYSVSKSALNPNSRWHRSFNLGFPNAFDRAHGRTGSFLMVHGGCASVGCYAMTDSVIDEIWRIVTRALDGGQARFQVQAFPFRMTPENLAAAQGSKWSSYWGNLKAGHDIFEAERLPPVVGVCGKSYAFSSGRKAADPTGPVTGACRPGTSAQGEESSALKQDHSAG